MPEKKLHKIDLTKLPNMGQPHYAYFQNKECEFFPCHKLPENGFHNCLFCYCPLYALGDKRCGLLRSSPEGLLAENAATCFAFSVFRYSPWRMKPPAAN